MRMNVFLGLHFAIWADKGDPDTMDVPARANALLDRGLANRSERLAFGTRQSIPRSSYKGDLI